MELARMLAPQTRVVFTTAFKEYAFESYEVSALDFLLKPIRYNKFLAAIDKARQWKAATTTVSQPQTVSPTLFLRVDGELHSVAIDRIVYVSGLKDYVMFYLDGENRPLVTHLTMKAVEEMLPAGRFLRVHRSYIVAVDKISKVDRNDCIYIGNEIIHVPDGYQQAFHAFLSSHTFNKM
jgi:DNA-binding LytR/AlgR family response regulator